MDQNAVKGLVEAAIQATRPEGVSTECFDDEQECAAPQLVLYFIWAKCLTINNAACPSWSFCTPSLPDP
jgi:hypothetical protein